MRLPSTAAACGIALCTLFLTPSRAAAQPAEPERQTRDRNANNLTIATYEVGDLVVHVPDYTLPTNSALASAQGGGNQGGGMGGMGGGYGSMSMMGRGMGMEGGFGGASMGMPGGSSGQQPVTIESLKGAIMSVIQPESWAMAQAGGEGRIEAIGTALVVAHIPDVHQAVGLLLDDLRQGSATRRTVSIDARWLLLDSDDLDKLVVTTDEGERRVDRQALEELTRRPTSLRGATKCFSGQAVYLISGTRRNVVSSYIPVVGSVDSPHADQMLAAQQVDPMADPTIMFAQYGGQGGEFGGEMGGRGRSNVGYQPIIEKPNFGVTLEIRPTLSTAGKNAVTDLKSTVTFPAQEMQAVDPVTGMPGMGAAPQVDRLAIQTQELATTLRVPLGQPTLVGGMTYLVPTAADAAMATPEGAQPAGGEQRQLYLVIELR